MAESVPTIAPVGGRLPRIGDAAKTAWIDVYRAFAALIAVWPIPLTISVALSVATASLTRGSASPSVEQIASWLSGIADAFFATPYIIAVHRFIILDEIAPRYMLRPGEPRFQKFFGWSLIFWASWIPVFVIPLAAPVEAATVETMIINFIVAVAFTLIWAILFSWAWLRLSILFPAIAMDAPGATWRNVMADTRGCAWQIFLIMLLAALPLLAVIIVFAVVSVAVGRETVAIDVISGVLEFVWTTLFVVIASRLYQRLGNRVNQPRGRAMGAA